MIALRWPVLFFPLWRPATPVLGPIPAHPLDIALAPQSNRHAALKLPEWWRGDLSRGDEALKRKLMHASFFGCLARGVGSRHCGSFIAAAESVVKKNRHTY
ncbi:MAG TPA: hypothetical protein VGS20_05940 [Candidatus Acidoferrales bacterium]|nr:hypothetical protein [Candidatus Acidoferrales bacterium]